MLRFARYNLLLALGLLPLVLQGQPDNKDHQAARHMCECLAPLRPYLKQAPKGRRVRDTAFTRYFRRMRKQPAAMKAFQKFNDCYHKGAASKSGASMTKLKQFCPETAQILKKLDNDIDRYTLGVPAARQACQCYAPLRPHFQRTQRPEEPAARLYYMRRRDVLQDVRKAEQCLAAARAKAPPAKGPGDEGHLEEALLLGLCRGEGVRQVLQKQPKLYAYAKEALEDRQPGLPPAPASAPQKPRQRARALCKCYGKVQHHFQPGQGFTTESNRAALQKYLQEENLRQTFSDGHDFHEFMETVRKLWARYLRRDSVQQDFRQLYSCLEQANQRYRKPSDPSSAYAQQIQQQLGQRCPALQKLVQKLTGDQREGFLGYAFEQAGPLQAQGGGVEQLVQQWNTDHARKARKAIVGEEARKPAGQTAAQKLCACMAPLRPYLKDAPEGHQPKVAAVARYFKRLKKDTAVVDAFAQLKSCLEEERSQYGRLASKDSVREACPKTFRSLQAHPALLNTGPFFARLQQQCNCLEPLRPHFEQAQAWADLFPEGAPQVLRYYFQEGPASIKHEVRQAYMTRPSVLQTVEQAQTCLERRGYAAEYLAQELSFVCPTLLEHEGLYEHAREELSKQQRKRRPQRR
jgi:hypothetical protein